jgi:hypothetical protein
VKKPLTNALIYCAIAGVLYLLILVSPEEIGFYGLLLFNLLHFPGMILSAFFFQSRVGEEPQYLRYVHPFVLIIVNATLIFLISWIARMSVRPNNDR